MDPHPRKHPIVQAGLTPLLIASILWALTLTLCPELHQRVHPDADHEDHDCAVTLFSNGGIHFVALDLFDARKPSNWLLDYVLLRSSQVLVSEQIARLIPGRGPPRSR